MITMRSAPAADAGKLAAVHNGGGRVVWAAEFGRHPDGIHTKATAQLLPWRSSHDVQHAPEVTCWPGCRIWGLPSLDGVSRLHVGHMVMCREDHIVECCQPALGAERT